MNKVIIIGSGPAGYTAAIYAARAGMSPIMFTGLKVGGQLMDTGDVENFPGYRNGVKGPEMMADLESQALRFGTEIKTSFISKVDFQNRPFRITEDNGREWESQSVIIATGAQAKWLGLESEKKYSGFGVSACATCDGFFYKNSDVVLVGGGDTACEEAIYLSNICKSVTMLVRSSSMRASKIMQERVNDNEKITILYNRNIEEILGDSTGVQSVRTDSGEIIVCSGVFIAIGHKPNTDIFRGQILLDEEGYIKTEVGGTKTNIEGIFACGDVQDKIYRQAITAAGTGCMAALDCERYLSNLK